MSWLSKNSWMNLPDRACVSGKHLATTPSLESAEYRHDLKGNNGHADGQGSSKISRTERSRSMHFHLLCSD